MTKPFWLRTVSATALEAPQKVRAGGLARSASPELTVMPANACARDRVAADAACDDSLYANTPQLRDTRDSAARNEHGLRARYLPLVIEALKLSDPRHHGDRVSWNARPDQRKESISVVRFGSNAIPDNPASR
jgi:hypothetical protein